MSDAPEAFLAALPEPKQAELRTLDALIRKLLPELRVVVQGHFLAYGPFHYRYASGREGDSARLSLAATAAGLSLYVNCVDEKGYLAEQVGKRLGKASVGKSCIRFKKLADLDRPELEALLLKAGRMKGAGEI